MEEKKHILERPLIVCLGATICCLLWGSAFPFVKIGFGRLSISSADIPAEILYAGLRFTLAGVMTIIIASCVKKRFVRPTVQAVPKIAALSLFQTILQYFFFYIGLSNTSGVKASVIEAANVFVALAVSCLIFRMEKVTAAKIVGSIIGFAGVVLVNLGGMTMGFTLTGEGFILISTVAYAFSSVLMKKWSTEYNPLMLSGWQFLFGGIVMAAGGFIAGGRIHGFDGVSVILLIYLAFVSSAAYSLWASLLKHNPVSKISVYGFLNPVFGVILSAVILGEAEQAFGWKSLAALALVCVGVYIVSKPKKE